MGLSRVTRGGGGGTALHLLHVVDLVVFALLVAGDLALRLLAAQIPHDADLRALPHRVLHRLGERQAGLAHPLVEAPVDCKAKRRRGRGGPCYRCRRMRKTG